MSQLLLEGGLYGHLNHLYDNPDMPFSILRKILNTASSGELVGTEKTDGQNLYLSYSVQEGVAKAARNKSNIKQGGMNAQALAAKFADRGALETAFNEAFAAFEQVVAQMDTKVQVKIFGEDANIYYNAEIMDPANPNVISYDTRSLVIHQQGHSEFNRETGKVVDSDVSKNVEVLQSALESVQQSQAAEDFTVQMNALKTLQRLDNDAALREAEARLDKLISSAGLSDKSTIGEYIVSKITPMVEEKFPSLDLERQKLLVKRLLRAEGATVTAVTKGLDPATKQAVSAFVKQDKKIMGNIIAPLESIVHDFSVEMLRGLQSAFILDNEKEVKRLAGEVKTAIDAIENSGRDDVMNVMAKHLQKIGNAENVSTAAEGFVFDWDGITYKFTGNFAPANQILGIFKYGRGKMPALQKEVIAEAPSGRRVGIVPGGFKPPHAGHYMGAEHLITKGGADEVFVLISPLEREGYSQDGSNKIEVSKRQSLQMWELYAEANGMAGKIIPQIASHESPVKVTYDFAATLSNGDTVLVGKGEKDANDQRFSGLKNFLAKKGLDQIEVEEVNTPMFGGGVSGTQMRRLIADGNIEEFKKNVPLKSSEDIQAAWEIVSTENTEDTVDKKAREKAKEEKEAAKKAEKERKKAEKAAAKAAKKNISENWMDVIDELIMEAVRVDHEAVPDGQLGGPKPQPKRIKKVSDDDEDDTEVNVNVNVETNVDTDDDDDEKVDEVANAMATGSIEGHHVGGKKKGAWADLDTEAENDEQERLNKKNRGQVKMPTMNMIKEDPITAVQQALQGLFGGGEDEEPEEGVKHLDQGLGLPRAELPQVKSDDMQNFIDWLKEKNVDVFKSKMEVGELIPIQKEINLEKVQSMMEKHSAGEIDLVTGKPVMVSADEHIIDGHHRWFALRELSEENEMETVNIELPVDKLLKVMKKYPGTSYKTAQMEGYENFGGKSQMIKVGKVRIDIEDLELEPTKHGEERRFRHQQSGKGHKISKDAIIGAVDRAIGLIMNDYANGELSNDEAFHIRMKGKSQQVPALNVIGVLDMKKGPDTMKIITVMRKDDFKTDNFGGKGGPQKTYNVGA